MPERQPRTVTRALNALYEPDPGSMSDAHRQIYLELTRLASRELRGETPGRTLDTTALVHEAFLRLTRNGSGPWESRWHFYGSAAVAMRRILVDAARRRKVHARAVAHFTAVGDEVEPPRIGPDVLELDEALNELVRFDPRLCEVVMLRYFAGLTIEETACAMGASERTVKRDWRAAKAWLYRRLASKIDSDAS